MVDSKENDKFDLGVKGLSCLIYGLLQKKSRKNTVSYCPEGDELWKALTHEYLRVIRQQNLHVILNNFTKASHLSHNLGM